MKQADLHRAIARATGETVDRIARMGFSYIETPARASQVRKRRRRRGRRHAQPRPVAALAV